MNAIEKINRINQQELQQNVSDLASWHADYSDTPYIYIGFLPLEILEMDVIKIFSQYGIPTHINLIRDRDTGKSRGFGYLKYEDHRLCVLAVDNLNGIKIIDKRIKVDHVYYQLRDGQREDDFLVDYSAAESELLEAKRKKERENQPRKLLAYKTSKKKEAEDDDIEHKHERDQDVSIDVEDEDDEFKDPMANFSSSNLQGKYEMIPEFGIEREKMHHKDRDGRKRRKEGDRRRSRDNDRKKSKETKETKETKEL